VPSFVQELFTSRGNYADGDTRIGRPGRIWYDSTTNTFRIQLDSTEGGTVISPANGTFDTVVGRFNPRIASTATASSLTPDISAVDIYAYTALASALEINAPIGTPLDGNKLIFRLLDNGTARALTWNATYAVVGTTLPTTTVINKTTYVGCIYNTNKTRWDVVAVTTEA